MNKHKKPNLWLSQIESCDETYQRLKDKAMVIVPTTQQLNTIRKILKKQSQLCASFHNPSRSIHNETIQFFIDNGFLDLTIRKNGKVGLNSIFGEIIVPIEYDDIDFTFDINHLFPNLFAVKKNNKWGVINNENKIVIPFEYDRIFRNPNHIGCYIVEQSGKYGYYSFSPFSFEIEIHIPCIMDRFYHIPGYCIIAFSKDEKWGWWWYDDSEFYNNFSEPEYDELIFKTKEDIDKADDNKDLVFYARKDNDCQIILRWTSK